MKPAIDSFEIRRLHDYKTYKFNFKDNTIVLVGENGSGKTTILRLLFYILTGQWNAIAQYKFEEISITIDNKKYSLKYEMLEKKIDRIDARVLRDLPSAIRHRFTEMLESTQGRISMQDLEALSERHDIPARFLLRQLELFDFHEKGQGELAKLFEHISKSFAAEILYLPTYRRIEQELNLIFKGIDEDERKRIRYPRVRQKEKSYVELIEFGMKDVSQEITNTLERLKEFARDNLTTLTLGYLGDVVDKKYSEVNIDEIRANPVETISGTLDRIDEKILSTPHKQHLYEKIVAAIKGTSPDIDEHTKVICHYFLKISRFQKELREKESQITSFCNVCNKYMVDKIFTYDTIGYNFVIEAKTKERKKRTIELRHLSSGEKQIVSLFSHLYLSGQKTFFVIIDEPELSLSVPWQRRFLMDIRSGAFCSGLIAATHSPFIYDNELKKYAHGIGEFEIDSENIK